jgi:hypothetical protein
MTVQLLFWIIAAILFFIAAFWNPGPRVTLGWLGCAFLALGFIFGGLAIAAA